jgi:hypothetical protein
MNRQRLPQQLACLGLTAVLLVGCSIVGAEPATAPTPIPPTPT